MEKKIPHVLLIYRRMIPSIRLCGHCQMEALAAEGKVEYRAIQEMRLKKADLEWAEIALLGRLDSWYQLQLVKRLKQAGKTLVYQIDDDLLNIPDTVSSAAYYNQKSIQQCIREIIRISDVLISPSPLLLRKYANGKKVIRIEEPAIHPVPFKAHDSQKPVRIGFAGSLDRAGDLEEVLRESLKAVKGKYGDKVSFEFFGARPSYADEIGASCIPYTNSYDDYRKTLNEAEWDIGLAPMPVTPFHACKHYNKFVEYAAAGIAGIYSNVPPYDRLEAFPGCAILCENTAEEWTKAICKLVDDPVTREEVRKKVSEKAENELSIQSSGEKILRELTGSTGSGGGNFRGLLFLKGMNVIKRTITSVKAHGVFGFIGLLLDKALKRGQFASG